MRSNKQETKFK